MGDGILDAAVPCRGELGRPREAARDAAIARYKAAMFRTVDALEADPPHRHVDVGSIAVACALGYLDFRYGGDPWRPGHPKLTAWFEAFAKSGDRADHAQGMIDLRDPGADAASVIAALDLRPHPEGGHFRETWRDVPQVGGRGAGTAILFLLRDGEVSHWHRVDAAELWIWQAGAALMLRRSPGADRTIGPNVSSGQVLHEVVPATVWQSARSTGAWSLCCCVVAPAFQFAGFELAPPGWEPAR